MNNDELIMASGFCEEILARFQYICN